MDKKVAIVMGSESDLKIMKGACEVLEQFEVGFVVRILSAHRTPEQVISWVEELNANDYQVIIAGAGGAAHLAGVIAAHTILPVIGVPVSSSLQGMDALLSTVQMPGGIPVAAVGIDRSKNAALWQKGLLINLSHRRKILFLCLAAHVLIMEFLPVSKLKEL
ncbi:5-(carboxyamino)imidazole ribonucleotide mutase [Candidatus Desantisbacteria bacterium]|nr:5-(carboxyamino)imidazole ribonucleotide mutase [Candidatus Desantisbacteria bacterium]